MPGKVPPERNAKKNYARYWKSLISVINSGMTLPSTRLALSIKTWSKKYGLSHNHLPDNKLIRKQNTRAVPKPMMPPIFLVFLIFVAPSLPLQSFALRSFALRLYGFQALALQAFPLQ